MSDHDIPRDDPRRRPPALSADEERVADLFQLAQLRVNTLTAAVVERDHTGRWLASLLDRRLRAGDDLHLVEPLLRQLLAEVQRIGDLMDLLTALHFEVWVGPIDWARLEREPAPWTEPFKAWPCIVERTQP